MSISLSVHPSVRKPLNSLNPSSLIIQRSSFNFLHHSTFIIQLSSFNLHHSTFILQPSSFTILQLLSFLACFEIDFTVFFYVYLSFTFHYWLDMPMNKMHNRDYNSLHLEINEVLVQNKP